MKKKFVAAGVLGLVLVMIAVGAVAAVVGITPFANPVFDSGGVSLNASMVATFTASTSIDTTIKVSSVTLQKKVNGAWEGAGSLTAPAAQSNISMYVAQMDYASKCESGSTYRIVVTYAASGETITRTSNERKK